MSAMRKMGVYLGLLEDADGTYVDADNEYDEPARRPEARTETRSEARPEARETRSAQESARPVATPLRAFRSPLRIPPCSRTRPG